MIFSQKSRYEKLSPQPDEHLTDEFSIHQPNQTQPQHRLLLLLTTFSAITAISTTILLTLTAHHHYHQPQALSPTQLNNVIEPYSPATGHYAYENRWLVGDPETPKFMGEPREELDQAWHDLLAGTLIRVSESELQQANATSIALKDGGFAAGLGISHSLHCLKRINQFFHKEYYYGHEGQDWADLENHVDHCLESLRQTLLCQPDTSLYTLEWTRHSRVKPGVRVPQAHACANFDMLHAWMNGRAARLDYLVPPPEGFYRGYEYDEVTGTVVGEYHHDSDAG